MHLNTKKLGRMGSRTGQRFDPTQRGRTRRLGWTVVHIAIDDHSRLAYVEELPDEFGETAAAFLARAIDASRFPDDLVTRFFDRGHHT